MQSWQIVRLSLIMEPLSIDTSGKMLTLAGHAFKFIAEKAKENANWKAHIVPVCRHNGTMFMRLIMTCEGGGCQYPRP